MLVGWEAAFPDLVEFTLGPADGFCNKSASSESGSTDPACSRDRIHWTWVLSINSRCRPADLIAGSLPDRIDHRQRDCSLWIRYSIQCTFRTIGRRSIRRLSALSLHLCRFNPPHQIVSKARKCPFESLAAFAYGGTFRRESLSNETNSNRT
jgi:hypothetical protein